MVNIGRIIIIKADDPDDTVYKKIIQVLESEQPEILTIQDRGVLSFPGLTILPYQRQVLRDGVEIPIAHLEFGVLLYLALQPNRVFSKEQIFEAVWNEDSDTCHHAVVSVIYQLRKKIETDPANPVYIQTVRNTGYKFVIPKE